MSRFDRFVLMFLITMATWCPGLARDFTEYVTREAEKREAIG